MFAMFSSSKSTSPSRVSIVEANSHLQMVHSKVTQLQQQIEEQNNQIIANEDSFRRRLSAIQDNHSEEVKILNNQIDSLKQTVIKT